MATSADWVGVIVVGKHILDCRLFSAFGDVRPFPIKQIHTKCNTDLSEIPIEEEEEVQVPEALPEEAKASEALPEEAKASEALPEEAKAPDELPPAQLREQFFCPKCQRPIKTDEVGQGIDTEVGVIKVSEAEMETLKFKPTKTVTAEFIQADDPAIEAIGFGRRLYVLPKPAAVGDYANVYYMLRESRRIGFISPLVIKQKPYVAVIRPLVIPDVVFGKEYSILVLDVINDTDKLKNPADFPDYPASLPPPNFAVLAQPIAEAQKIESKLDPERCVNPKRLRYKEIVKRAVSRSLKK